MGIGGGGGLALTLGGVSGTLGDLEYDGDLPGIRAPGRERSVF